MENVHPVHIQTIGIRLAIHVHAAQILILIMLKQKNVYAHKIHLMNLTIDALLVIIPIIGMKLQEFALHVQKLTNLISSSKNVFVLNNYLTTQEFNVLAALGQNIGIRIPKLVNNVPKAHIIQKAS